MCYVARTQVQNGKPCGLHLLYFLLPESTSLRVPRFPGALPEDACRKMWLHPASSLFPTLVLSHDSMWVPLHHLIRRGRGAEGSERRLEDAWSGDPGYVCMTQTACHFSTLSYRTHLFFSVAYSACPMCSWNSLDYDMANTKSMDELCCFENSIKLLPRRTILLIKLSPVTTWHP